MFNSLQRRGLFLLGALLALMPSLGATWSIVAVNRRTGEVCISSATCIPRADLSEWTPVLLVGVGGGVTQSVLDDGSNKLRIHDGFLAGDSPQTILARILAEDPGYRTRQFGIVDFTHDPLSYTGSQAAPAKKSVTGVVGDIVYAIQGNVLVHQRVINECEAVLRTSTGDLGQRVLDAMVRARELGGDGRCSCGLGDLGDCGFPEPGFEKSAHCGFLLLARIGDADGGCVLGESCADGPYTLRLSISGADALHNDPDPVDQLVERYAAWRAARAGRPDGILSRVHAVDSLPADGSTERTVTVELVDLDGQPLTHGGATLEVASAGGAPFLATVGPVADRGDGTYSFTLRSGTASGLDRFVIRASDELVHATLYPYTEVRSEPPQVLHAGRDTLSAVAPEAVPLAIREPSSAGAKFWLFTRLPGPKHLVAGSGAAFARYLFPGVTPFFPGLPGQLDALGRGEAVYAVPAGVLTPLIGQRLEWTARIYGAGAPLESDPVGLEIVP